MQNYVYMYDLQKSGSRDFEIGSLKCTYDSKCGAMYQQLGKQFVDNFRRIRTRCARRVNCLW